MRAFYNDLVFNEISSVYAKFVTNFYYKNALMPDAGHSGSHCNPNILEGQGGQITGSRDRDHSGQHGETPSLLKIQKISWARWRVPVIPATQEAEAGELPEPRRQRLQ